MKKTLFVLFILILVISQPSYVFAESSIDVTRAHGNNVSDFYQPKGSIIADSHTGRILWEEHIDKPWRPASMSKLMTLSIVLERIQDGTLSMDKSVTVTADDERFSHHPLLSNNIMHKGTHYTIKELINLLIVPSSNVATRMLMQQVEPDTGKFVTMMNQKAKKAQDGTHTFYQSIWC
ncbi:serine hydrolase [Staphylococcus xylosus]|uniref:serine hydrolase n=1 Tax=Staphylococcus xylosus TaxID=1288 RepID=UPI00398ABCB1